MQMLSAIQPNVPSATAHQGKASEPTSKGVFQNVLNQESCQPGMTEGNLSAKQSEGKTAKHNATKSPISEEQQPDTTSEDIVNQEAQAILAGAQNILPIPSVQEQLPKEAADSEQQVAPATDIIPAQTALQTPNDASRTDISFETSITNHADQPVAETLQSPKGDNADTETPSSQGVVDSQPTEISKTVASQTNKQVELPLPPAQQPVATEPAAQEPSSIRRQQEQTSIAASEMAASVAEKTSKSAQQIVPAQSALAPVGPNGQPVSLNTTRKTKTETLGDSRFAQLLGRQDTAVSDTAAAENSATGSQQAAENPLQPRFTMGATPIKDTAIQTEKVTSPAPGIAALTGEETNATQAAELGTQPVYAEIDNLVNGNNETATGLPENSVQPALAGSVSTPAFSPVQTSATQATTLQHNTGFPIPEQEVMQQVIQRSSLRELEGKRELTVELHPEDLGQVKLNLVQEKDQLQLHLQAQSGEVRDILEKHLPRLQEALQQQGLRLETIQVSVDAQRNNTQEFFQHQQQQQAQRNPWQRANRSSLQSEEQALPDRATMASSAKGLSLRI